MIIASGEVSVTHEIVIDGEKSWIKYGIHYFNDHEESDEEARERASQHVNEGVLRVIRETVETVREATT